MPESEPMKLPPGFFVKVKNRADGQESVLHVSRNSRIASQKAAESYIESMPTSHGGKHPGFDVISSPVETPVVDQA